MKNTIIASKRFTIKDVRFEVGDEFDFTVLKEHPVRLRNLIKSRYVHYGVPAREIKEVVEASGYKFDEKNWVAILKNKKAEKVSKEEKNTEGEVENELNPEVLDEAKNEDMGNSEATQNDEGAEGEEATQNDEGSESNDTASEDKSPVQHIRNKNKNQRGTL